MMTEPGGAGFDDEEAAKLRLYLEKGGFLWADDFWGEYAWSWWVGQLRKALPASEFPIFDVPPEHPMFHTQFEVEEGPADPVDQLLLRIGPNVGARRRQRRRRTRAPSPTRRDASSC